VDPVIRREERKCTDRSAPALKARPATRDWNRTIGWASLAVSAGTGLVLGLWSFDGPMDAPAWLGGYTETSRRLTRLGHIAWFGLGILNLLLARELPRSGLGLRGRRTASVSMNFGNVFLPLVLFAASAWRPLKYLLPIPAASVFVALVIAARGASRPRGPRYSDGEPPDDAS
jgi:hypothetical protein